MADLLRLLLRVAEKAANVARVCRQEALLFQLLVQEKTGKDKNKKFVQDFKTLADVVIQEMIRHDVGTQFDEMIGFIHGEESNKFENGLGESVTVTVCVTEEETAALLATVLDGDHMAASLLARAIHQDPVAITDISTETLNMPLSPTDLGIWIDPIDATSQYIEGREEVLVEGHLSPSGLQCALVLIGVYHRATGEPVMGVINQPFHHKDSTGGWKGQHFWGVSYGSFKACSVDRPKDGTKESTGRGGISVVLSSSEKQAVKEALTPLCGLDRLMYASGAGYKILCVIQGLADIYVLSEGSTFKWDSCAPHALLRALGGGMVDLAECLRSSSGERGHQEELTYHRPLTESPGADRWANQGGLVAYLDSKLLQRVILELKGKF
ncbi:inositol polyphosphate 1-phosphatase [Hypomesus transpacificus]|uniref:inositol polyphosphate 1-phosphatase n=1 Tax=Hypomesus transpacificus TaxID=137520 RepID=UPI001F072A31|nr:inositol polyphosphate 1-phosphatase [Hypomesus transpacificus]